MKLTIAKNIWQVSSVLILIATLFTQQVAAATRDSVYCAQLGGIVCNYEPGLCTTPASTTIAAGSGVTINNTAAQQAAQQASTGGTNVGYALYDSTGKLLANYNDTFENYGANITKSMLLVAYLDQVGSGTLSPTAVTNLTGMIEDSDNGSAAAPGPAYWVYSNLNHGLSDVTAVASAAGMTGFKPDTSDPEYVLGQSQITANDFAKFFSKIDTLIPTTQQSFGLGLLSHLSSADQNGLLQSGLSGTVYSNEGWKPEPGPTNPFGNEGAPYVVNQAAQFSSGGTSYGVAVTVSGTADETSGETIVKDVVSALVSPASASTPSSTSSDSCSCSSGSSSSGPTMLTGSDNEEKIFNYFVGKGLNATQAAAIDGNFGQESTYNPSEPGGYLAQWDSTRLNALAALASSEGKPITDLGVQLDFVWQELNSDYSSVLKNLKAATSIDDAVNQFMGPDNYSTGQPVSVTDPSQRSNGYEDPGTPAGQNRVNFANDALSKYGGSAGTGSMSGCTSSSGSPDCTTATGDTKILCEAKQFTGIYYEYGGGHGGDYSAYQKQCPDPTNPPDNQPNGGPVNGDPFGRSGNPSPCALDCSALVSFAVDAAFNLNYIWTVAGSMQGTGANYWQSIPWSAAQPGDIATSSGHTEIIDHVSGSTVYTFGAHDTGSKDGPTSYPTSFFTGGAWHWTKPEST